MLTKTDLFQIEKIVGKIVQRELLPIHADIKSLKLDVVRLKSGVKSLQTDVKSLKRDTVILKKEIKIIKTDINIVISVFDRDYMTLQERVEKIEEHLPLKAS